MWGADEADTAPRGRGVTCPTCGGPTPWSGNPHPPFWSLTCRLIDPGGRVDEGHRNANPRAESNHPHLPPHPRPNTLPTLPSPPEQPPRHPPLSAAPADLPTGGAEGRPVWP